jgi:DNA-binding XRE family transcriptional regulator
MDDEATPPAPAAMKRTGDSFSEMNMKHQTLTRRGKKYVLVEESEYQRLTQAALPLLPRADASGNRPAVAFGRASIARGIIRDRQAAGLNQLELARRAGIRPETLNRIEKGHTTPDVATLSKIDAALRRTKKPVARRLCAAS